MCRPSPRRCASSPSTRARSSSSRRRSPASPTCCSRARRPRPPGGATRPPSARRSSCERHSDVARGLRAGRPRAPAAARGDRRRRTRVPGPVRRRSACSATWPRARATCSSRAASGCRRRLSRPRSHARAGARRTSTPWTSSSPTATTAAPRPTSRPTARLARQRVRPLIGAGTTAVVPGFIGRAPDGSVTTLGRGGTDLTATLLARALGAKRVVLWKDVPGNPDRRSAPRPRRAAHPAAPSSRGGRGRALRRQGPAPARAHPDRRHAHRRCTSARSSIPISRAPRSRRERSDATYPVKALAIVRGQAIVTVAGKGMVGVHGIAARTFAAVDAERLSVSTIFQASSESSIGFTLPEARGRARGEEPARARSATSWPPASSTTSPRARAWRSSPSSATAWPARRASPRASSRRSPPAASTSSRSRRARRSATSRLPSTTEQAPKPRDASTPRSSSRRSAADGPRRAAHRRRAARLRPGRPRARRSDWRGRTVAVSVRVVGLLDRSGYVFDPRGLSRRRLPELAREKDAGALLASLGGRPAPAAEALTFMAGHAVSRPVVVDVTSEETGDLLRAALGHGFDVVLANKKPLAGSWESYAALVSAPGARRPAGQVRGDGRRGAADHRHVPQARRDRRSRAADRRHASAAR